MEKHPEDRWDFQKLEVSEELEYIESEIMEIKDEISGETLYLDFFKTIKDHYLVAKKLENKSTDIINNLKSLKQGLGNLLTIIKPAEEMLPFIDDDLIRAKDESEKKKLIEERSKYQRRVDFSKTDIYKYIVELESALALYVRDN